MVHLEKEMNFLRVMLRQIAGGRGGVVVVSGPPGSGKTRLLHRFADLVAGSEALLLGATASRREQAFRFEVVGQLVEKIGEHPGHDHDFQNLGCFTRCAGVGSSPSCDSNDEVCAPAVQTLWTALTRLAANSPVVIAVDDVHWADEASLRCLLTVARRLPYTRMLLVLGMRTWPQHDYHPLHAELLSQPHCHRVRLSPLSLVGVRALLAQALGETEADRLAVLGHEVTGGNRLLLNAMVEDVLGARTPEPVGEAYGEAVLTCLHHSTPRMLEVARIIAVLGGSAAEHVIGGILGVDVDTVTRCLAALEFLGVLRDRSFRHDAGRQAVLDQVGAEERAAIHRSVATLLHQDGVADEPLARHLLAAGPPFPSWSVRVLRTVAEQALQSDSPHLAARCLAMARAASPSRPERDAITVEFVSARWRADPATALRYLPELAAAVRDRTLPGRHVATLLPHLLWHGRFDDAAVLLDRLADLPSADAASVEVEFLRPWLAYQYPSMAPRLPLPPERGPVPATASWSGPRQQVARVLRTYLSGDLGDALLDYPEKVLHDCRLSEATLEPITAVLAVLVQADRAGAAARWCEALSSEPAVRDAPTWQAVLTGHRAEIALREGDMVAAHGHAAEALAALDPRQWGVGIASPLATALLAVTEMGDAAEGARLLRHPVPDTVFRSRFGLTYLHARGHHLLATGHAHAARDDFALCGELMTAWGVDLPDLVAWRADLAMAWLAVGGRDQARALLEEQLTVTTTTTARTRGAALRLLAATRDQPDRHRLLLESCDILRAAGARLELAKALVDLSQSHRLLGEHDQARLTVRRATRIAKQCGADSLRSVIARGEIPAPRRPDMVVSRTRDVATLSGAERRVAALAARGMSNRQIGRRLCITVSTVEQHLTRAYRKLNVNRRTELPAELEFTATDRN